MSVCLSTHITRKPHGRTSPNCLCMLTVTMAQSSSGSIVICYVLPVLWMTSCFHITALRCIMHIPRQRQNMTSIPATIPSKFCSVITLTHTQPFYGSMDFVWDNPGEPVPEETFSHLSWSSIVPISFIHLLRSMASSLFNPHTWQSLLSMIGLLVMRRYLYERCRWFNGYVMVRRCWLEPIWPPHF